MDLTTSFTAFKELLEKGQTLKAIQQYFADSYQQFENGNPIPPGKDLIYKMEKDNLDKVTSLTFEFRDCVIEEAGQKVWGEMDIHFKTTQEESKHLHEAFFQQWENGQIIVQRFYYKTIETVQE